MQDVHKNIEECSPDRTLKVFYNMIANMINNTKLNEIVTELFIIRKKTNISIVFITQFCFSVAKDVKLNCTHFFIMKNLNK